MLGGELTTQGELIDKAAAIGGKKPPRMTVPPLLLKAMIPVGRCVGPPMGLPPNFREMISAADNVTYLGQGRQGAPRAGLRAARPRHWAARDDPGRGLGPQRQHLGRLKRPFWFERPD